MPKNPQPKLDELQVDMSQLKPQLHRRSLPKQIACTSPTRGTTEGLRRACTARAAGSAGWRRRRYVYAGLVNCRHDALAVAASVRDVHGRRSLPPARERLRVGEVLERLGRPGGVGAAVRLWLPQDRLRRA